MPVLRFYLTDITYRVVAGRAVLYLYGRAEDGNFVCVTDSTFDPYFYVLPKPDRASIVREELLKTSVKDEEGITASVVNVEMVRKKVAEQEKELFKVTTNLPGAVPTIKDAARALQDVQDCFEYDIKFVRRYLIDKGLSPMMLTSAEAVESNEKSKVPVFAASRVWQDSDDALKRPKILAVDIETYNPAGRSINMRDYPIVLLALYGEGFQRVLSWKRFPTSAQGVEFLESEAEMLHRFLEIVDQYRPDILVGYNSDGFDLPYIKTRAEIHKTRLPLGLDFSEMRMQAGQDRSVQVAGLFHLDVFRFIKRVVARGMKTDSFTLDAVAKELLGAEKVDVPLDRLAESWDRHPDEMHQFVIYNLHDAKLTYDLAVKVLPNLLEMVRIVGVPAWDVSRMAFSQLVEWFIIKQAASFNEVVLNRPSQSEQQRRSGQRLIGASVLEPRPGLYEDIVVFDYRSLYPSIIVSHNISIGTLNCRCCQGRETVPFEGAKYWYCRQRKGFVSTIIGDLIERRNRIKEILKKEKTKDPLLVARSEALKVLANAFYGYLGFAPARWYCFECGQSVTAYARHYIQKVIEGARNSGFDVLYSDTDSVFLVLHGKTKADALSFVQRINTELPGVMELDYENYYPSGLFVATKMAEGGAKKRYALIDEHGNLKIRGFEVVRRNVSPIAKRAQEIVLRTLLGKRDVQGAQRVVQDIVRDLRENKISASDVVIATALTKDISEYESIGPHVAAAQRMRDKGVSVAPGVRIEYVIAKGKGLVRDKARLPSEISRLDYDGDYYVHHQVIPAVEKIFEVVGVDIAKATAHKDQKTLTGF